MGQKYQPKPSTLEDGKSEMLNGKRRSAHENLDEMIDFAERGRIYGEVAVTIRFKNGNPTQVEKTLRASDQPNS